MVLTFSIQQRLEICLIYNTDQDTLYIFLWRDSYWNRNKINVIMSEKIVCCLICRLEWQGNQIYTSYD